VSETKDLSLGRIDVNLLIALDAIFKEGSVSGAATRLGTSQPSISHKLGRLRELLGDPLLVRHGRGLVPTPRAAQLAEPLAAALGQLEKVLAPATTFEPTTATGVIQLACKFSGMSLVPDLVDRFSIAAPRLNMHVLQVAGEEAHDRLAMGHSDVLIQPSAGKGITSLSRGQTRKVSEHLYSQRLYTDPWVIIMREGHPLASKPLTPASFASTPQVLVSLRGDAYGFVDRVIEGIGLKRRIALLVQSFELGCVEVARTDMLMTTNLSIAMPMQRLLPLRIIPMPIDLPEPRIFQVWHERAHHDPMQKWIRRQILECGHQIEEKIVSKAASLDVPCL